MPSVKRVLGHLDRFRRSRGRGGWGSAKRLVQAHGPPNVSKKVIQARPFTCSRLSYLKMAVQL